MNGYHKRKEERRLEYQQQHGNKLIVCIVCNVTGRHDHNGSPRCSACGGTGKVRERE